MLHRFLSYFFKFRHGFSKIDCDGGVHYVVDFCGTNRNLFEVQVSFEPSDPSSVWRIGNKEGKGGGEGVRREFPNKASKTIPKTIPNQSPKEKENK